MPIRAEMKDRYPREWPAISAAIRERAGNKCEECGAPNGATVERGNRLVMIVLTVAHLNHQPEDCRPENLRCWCQQCHNRYDAPERRRGIKERAKAKCAIGDFFG